MLSNNQEMGLFTSVSTQVIILTRTQLKGPILKGVIYFRASEGAGR